MRFALAFLLCAASLSAAPKTALKVPRFHYDVFTLAHAGAALFDGKVSAGYTELNPVTRPLIGSPVSFRREMAFGTLEIGSVAAIPNKKVRRIVEVSLVGAHLACGIYGLEHH